MAENALPRIRRQHLSWRRRCASFSAFINRGEAVGGKPELRQMVRKKVRYCARLLHSHDAPVSCQDLVMKLRNKVVEAGADFLVKSHVQCVGRSLPVEPEGIVLPVAALQPLPGVAKLHTTPVTFDF